jgi:hypothetical protein
VTLRLAKQRVSVHGPLRVVVANGNDVAITAKLSGTTSGHRGVGLAARTITVGAKRHATGTLSLPKRARRALAHTHRLRATVRDPAGDARTVAKTVTVPAARR